MAAAADLESGAAAGAAAAGEGSNLFSPLANLAQHLRLGGSSGYSSNASPGATYQLKEERTSTAAAVVEKKKVWTIKVVTVRDGLANQLFLRLEIVPTETVLDFRSRVRARYFTTSELGSTATTVYVKNAELDDASVLDKIVEHDEELEVRITYTTPRPAPPTPALFWDVTVTYYHVDAVPGVGRSESRANVRTAPTAVTAATNALPGMQTVQYKATGETAKLRFHAIANETVGAFIRRICAEQNRQNVTHASLTTGDADGGVQLSETSDLANVVNGRNNLNLILGLPPIPVYEPPAGCCSRCTIL